MENIYVNQLRVHLRWMIRRPLTACTGDHRVERADLGRCRGPAHARARST